MAAVLIPPLGLVVSPYGAYLALKREDQTAMYAYGLVFIIDMLWLSWVLEGAIAL